jgi:hypothetical protein
MSTLAQTCPRASEIVGLDGPPADLDAVLPFISEQFGSKRRLVSGHRDRGLADQFQRLRDEWMRGSRQSLWFAARSASKVRTSDSPFSRVVMARDRRPHTLSLTAELAALHEQRVAAAFARLPTERRTLLCDHFVRLGLMGAGRRAVFAFWLRFIPIILLEDRTRLWPWLDSIAKLTKLPRA